MRLIMAQGRVVVFNEVSLRQPDDWALCFQWCRYMYDDGNTEDGYRFIWRRPGGNLQGARGQARIPSIKVLRELVHRAETEGWGHHEANLNGLLI